MSQRAFHAAVCILKIEHRFATQRQQRQSDLWIPEVFVLREKECIPSWGSSQVGSDGGQYNGVFFAQAK
jgi:hypothetical protein